MKKRNGNMILTLFVIFISIPFSYSQTTKPSTKITYIANEGFLINIGDKSILIDALFGDKDYGFCVIPDSTQISDLTEAKNQFSNIDLVAVTHNHIDHFHAPYVSEHLTNNNKGKFISSEQTIGKLAETDNYEEIKARLIEITPDSLTHQDTVINEIGVKVLRLKHAPYYVENPETGEKINEHRNMQHLGFIFNINGVKIFHCGDSKPSCISDYKNFRLDKENIDIAFLGYDFMASSDCEGIDIIRDYINPKHIVLMHIYNEHKKYIDVAEQVKDEFPSVNPSSICSP